MTYEPPQPDAETEDRVFNPETRRALQRETWTLLCLGPAILAVSLYVYATFYLSVTAVVDVMNVPAGQATPAVLALWLLSAAYMGWVAGRNELIQWLRETLARIWREVIRPLPHHSLVIPVPHLPRRVEDSCQTTEGTCDRVLNAETRRALRRGARRLLTRIQAPDDTATGGDSDR